MYCLFIVNLKICFFGRFCGWLLVVVCFLGELLRKEFLNVLLRVFRKLGVLKLRINCR